MALRYPARRSRPTVLLTGPQIVPTRSPTQSDEVADGGVGGSNIVDIDVADVVGAEGATGNHQGQVGIDHATDDPLLAVVTGLDHHAIQQTLVRQAGKDLLFVALIGGEKQRQGVIVLVAGLGNPLGEVGIIIIGEKGNHTVREDQANHPGVLRSEGAGGGMGVITGFLDDAQDAFTDSVAHAGVVVHHAVKRLSG